MEAHPLAAGKKKAVRLGAHLVFVDESGFLLVPTVRRPWAPRGQTPLLRHWERRDKRVYGSWLKALIEVGVLGDGTRRTSRGTQTIAADGHVCLSLAEKTIDDWLSQRGIPHEKEPHYPEGRFRADFKVGRYLIEYLGLIGDAMYDARVEAKRHTCTEHGLALITVLPEDLVGHDGLDRKLGSIPS